MHMCARACCVGTVRRVMDSWMPCAGRSGGGGCCESGGRAGLAAAARAACAAAGGPPCGAQRPRYNLAGLHPRSSSQAVGLDGGGRGAAGQQARSLRSPAPPKARGAPLMGKTPQCPPFRSTTGGRRKTKYDRRVGSDAFECPYDRRNECVCVCGGGRQAARRSFGDQSRRCRLEGGGEGGCEIDGVWDGGGTRRQKAGRRRHATRALRGKPLIGEGGPLRAPHASRRAVEHGARAGRRVSKPPKGWQKGRSRLLRPSAWRGGEGDGEEREGRCDGAPFRKADEGVVEVGATPIRPPFKLEMCCVVEGAPGAKRAGGASVRPPPAKPPGCAPRFQCPAAQGGAG